MKTVVLRLEGPLQSWGTQGRFAIRVTDREPSKSGVLGLVGCALGMERNDGATLQQLRQLRMATRVDRQGELVRDYHTVGGGSGREGIWSIKEGKHDRGLTAVTERYYLADARFIVALGSEDTALVERVALALQSPCWPLYLGRRSCVPSAPVFAGVYDIGPEKALRAIAYEDRRGEDLPDRLRMVVEAAAEDGTPRQDDPVSFALYERSHRLRHVRTEFVSTAALGSSP